MTSQVHITAEQLPEPLRPLLADYHQAQQEAQTAHRNATTAPRESRHELQELAQAAARKTAETKTALLDGTREHPTEMREHTHARFMSCIERAREHLQTAEQELRAAAGFSAVHHSVLGGKPTVNTERGHDAPGKKRAMLSVGLVRDATDSLPEDLD